MNIVLFERVEKQYHVNTKKIQKKTVLLIEFEKIYFSKDSFKKLKKTLGHRTTFLRLYQ